MAKEIKAIETEYNGYKFRSRLEARWAVFFDVAKIKYQYEPEGFELPNGLRYLPDFYLPDVGCFVEIKPSKEVIPYVDIQKIDSFALEGDNHLLLIIGIPNKHEFRLFDRCNAIPLREVESYFEKPKEQVDAFIESAFKVGWGFDIIKDSHILSFVEDDWDSCVSYALDKAQKSRFEFGEKG